jgi:ABC-type xylose transport system permease subunit
LSARWVVYANLSSLIATLGMNFVLRGIILIVTEGKSIALVTLGQTWACKLFSSVIWGIPVQILWAIAFVVGLPLPPPSLRGAGARRRRQSRQRPADGDKRSAGPGASSSSGSAPPAPASSRR